MKRLLLLLLLASPALAQRSLEWELIAVKARLDETGVLHISEEQHYVSTETGTAANGRFDSGKSNNSILRI